MSSKPKSLVDQQALALVEQRIVDALPEIVDGIIDRAKNGNMKLSVYLCDRILSRSTAPTIAPAEDQQIPIKKESFRIAAMEEGSRQRAITHFLGGSGATKGT